MIIVKKGTFNNEGDFFGWSINGEGRVPPSEAFKILRVDDGRVMVGDVEIAEWTEERRKSML